MKSPRFTVAVVAGTGAFLMAEGGSVLDALWLTFTVVSTTGFGDGPATPTGQLIAVGLFAWAAVSYLVLLAAAVSYGQLVAEDRRRLLLLEQRDVRRVVRGLHRN